MVYFHLYMHIYHPSPIYYTIDGNVEAVGVCVCADLLGMAFMFV